LSRSTTTASRKKATSASVVAVAREIGRKPSRRREGESLVLGRREQRHG
jgi:hypothetical protein